MKKKKPKKRGSKREPTDWLTRVKAAHQNIFQSASSAEPNSNKERAVVATALTLMP